MDSQKLDELQQAAKDYIKQEKKVLQAQFDFLTSIQSKRGLSSLNKNISDSIGERAKKSLEEYTKIT
jgi:Holliday junction resolvase-like predicted endonuclease